MRTLTILVVGLTLLSSAYAELQDVGVGGLIEMRGRWISHSFNRGRTGFGPTQEIRGPASWFPRRAIGNPSGVIGILDWNDTTNDWVFAEETTSLNVTADFTDHVTGFVEFYAYNIWGEDFRSDYKTGVDSRAVSNGDCEILQSYIETKDTFGQPLTLRVGRQCMKFGKNFLIADKTTPTRRVSFDAVRATYNPTKELTIDAWWAKVAENSPLEEDGDVDFYGLYGTYAYSDAINASAYWMLVRDACALKDTQLNWFGERLEDLIRVDNYDVTNLNTVGGRFWGKYEALDYSLEAAYQFGQADANGVSFKKQNLFGAYGDDGAKWGQWGADVEVGYTFDCMWKPRVFIGGVHYGGDDNRSVSFLDWLNPFSRPRASISFSRLFSDINYAPTLQDNGEMSNFNQVRGGVNLTFTEKLSILLRAQQLWADSTFAWPVHWRFGRYVFPIAPIFSFWTQESSNNIGLHLDTVIKYQYSSALTFMIYYGHLFAGQGLIDGNYSEGFGNQYIGGSAKDDADYAFWWAILKF